MGRPRARILGLKLWAARSFSWRWPASTWMWPFMWTTMTRCCVPWVAMSSPSPHGASSSGRSWPRRTRARRALARRNRAAHWKRSREASWAPGTGARGRRGGRGRPSAAGARQQRAGVDRLHGSGAPWGSERPARG